MEENSDQTFNIEFLKLRISENVGNFQKSTEHRYSLLYASLDIRYLIEKIMDVYFVLVNDSISKNEAKQYKPDDRIRLIKKYEAYLDKKIEYIKIIGEIENNEILRNQKIPNLNILSVNYGKINDYLHLPKEPEKKQDNSEWWFNLLELLVNTYNYISDLTEYPIGFPNDFTAKLEDPVKQFCTGEISREELKSEMIKLRSSSHAR